ncbi:MAG: CRTAC1 family protein [Phycisphaerales bacterium]
MVTPTSARAFADTRAFGLSRPLLSAACATASLASIAAATPPVVPFTEEAVDRGLVHYVEFPQLYGQYGFGSGFVDLDNDGDPDVVLLGRTDLIVSVYENDGTGHFISRSATCGIGAIPKQSSFAAGDYDGDGYLDLYITQAGGTCKLFHNNGNWTFTDVTAASGATTNGVCKGAAWGDIDGDGDLDLHVAVYRNAFGAPNNIPSAVFRNNGDGTFTNISASIPGFLDPAYSFTGTWTDIDLDGDVDLYVSNDRGHLGPFFQGNQLWRNDNGTFVEISDTSGAGVQLFSMGLACGDFDNNGLPDFYCANIANLSQPLGGLNPLLLNQDGAHFVQGQVQWNVGAYMTGWGAEFFDFNNDGNLDLYINNQLIPNAIFLNPGVPPCINVSAQANVPGSDAYSYASSAADVDMDGDLDLLVGDVGSNALLYINHSGDGLNWMKLRPVGIGRNTFAVGGFAKIWLDANGSPRFRDIYAGGRSYLGSDQMEMFVGLETRATLPKVEMHWPKGPSGVVVRTLTNLPANHAWSIYPPGRLGDADGDGFVTRIDHAVFDACLAEGFVHGCEMMDFDGDSDIDAADQAAFLKRASDFDGDGVVGASDLGILLGAWGTPNLSCDLDGSGLVGAADLAVLLGAWG